MRTPLADLAGAWWAFRAVPITRRAVDNDPMVPGTRLPRIPAGARSGIRGVTAVLRLRRSNCLVSAVILQAWYAARGDRRDVVIGVTAPSSGFRAHAWLDGERVAEPEPFVEITRLRAPS